MGDSMLCSECKHKDVLPGHYVCSDCEATIMAAGRRMPSIPKLRLPWLTPPRIRLRFRRPSNRHILIGSLIVVTLIVGSVAAMFAVASLISGSHTPTYLAGVKATSGGTFRSIDEARRKLFDVLGH